MAEGSKALDHPVYISAYAHPTRFATHVVDGGVASGGTSAYAYPTTWYGGAHQASSTDMSLRVKVHVTVMPPLQYHTHRPLHPFHHATSPVDGRAGVLYITSGVLPAEVLQWDTRALGEHRPSLRHPLHHVRNPMLVLRAYRGVVRSARGLRRGVAHDGRDSRGERREAGTAGRK